MAKILLVEDGKTHMNNAFSKTRAHGVLGTKLCFQVRNIPEARK